jgi:hypothetical protein
MCSPAYERRGDMRRKDVEKHIRQQNRIAEREAELNRIKAQLYRRISAFMSEIPRVAENEPSAHNSKIPELLPKGT